MYYGLTSVHCRISIHDLLSAQRLQAYTVVKVGGSVDQGPATEVTHLRLNQPPVRVS